MGYRVINGQLYPVGSIPETKKSNFHVDNNVSKDSNFKDILDKKVSSKDTKNSFVISNHAAKRLDIRNISFTEGDVNKINTAINKADEKGARECLILYKDTALITSIKNRTIITAVPKEEMNVFTNVDTVVLI